jgi:hypothetical protein
MSKYQRRHYQLIADILSQIQPRKAREKLVRKYCLIFAADNQNFSPQKFREACGV